MRSATITTIAKRKRNQETKEKKAKKLLDDLARFRARIAKTEKPHKDAVSTIREIRSGR